MGATTVTHTRSATSVIWRSSVPPHAWVGQLMATVIDHIPWVSALVWWLPRMLKLQDRFPVKLRLHRFILCTRRSGGTAHESRGCHQEIGSTVSDAIVHSWLWSTATMSSHWATSEDYCKLLIIDHTFCVSRFSTGRLLAIEHITFTNWSREGHSCEVKGCNTLTVRGRRTQPLLMMAIQSPTNRKEAWTSSKCTEAIYVSKQ